MMRELERVVARTRRSPGRRVMAVSAAIASATSVGVIVLASTCDVRSTRVVVTQAPPVIVTVDRVVEPPAPAEPAAPLVTRIEPTLDDLTCPVFDATSDRPVGTRVTPTKTEDADPAFQVAAAAAAPRISILNGGDVLVSDDDGKRFSPAFVGHDIRQIALARDGTLYAVEDNQLGVRTFPGAREVWRRVPGAGCKGGECGWCDNRIAVVDDRLAWFHSSEISVSTDRGHHWKDIAMERQAWSGSTEEPVIAFRGDLYQVEHYVERCGIDDTPVWRLDRHDRIDHTIFHNYYEEREPVLEADDEVNSSWHWRERCWGKDADILTSCTTRRIPSVSAMLRVGTLRPVEGARALALYSGSLIELCDDGARQIYRTFPFDRIDAVDAQGRPLVVHGNDLLRWSRVHGWRRLYRAPAGRDEE